jgi:hypothetical protein
MSGLKKAGAGKSENARKNKSHSWQAGKQATVKPFFLEKRF